MRKISITLTILLATLISIHTVFAKWGLETLTGTGLPTDEPNAFIARVVSYVMGFIGVVLIVVIIYGGFLYMTSRGNEKQTETAKAVLTYAVIGVVIVFASYIIARFVISALTAGSSTSGTGTQQQGTRPDPSGTCQCSGDFYPSVTSQAACQTECKTAGQTMEKYVP